jgi:gluconokinase
MGFINTHTKVYDKSIMEFAGVEQRQFGHLATYNTACPLNKEGAEALGISSGIPVVAPYSDGAMNQVGSGATKPNVMTFSVGTSAAIRMTTNRPVLSEPPGTWCYIGATGWMSGAATQGACNCIDWFKTTVLQNKWSYDELGTTLSDESETPVFLPFLFGERCPGWQDGRRAGFSHIDARTTVPNMYKAICEGILFNVYQCYEILTKHAGTPSRIIISGGILNSPAWTQLAADIFNREIEISETKQASMLGGAALALYASNQISQLHSIQESPRKMISPREGMVELYRTKFKRYLECYNL